VRFLRVIEPGMLSTVQDLGREGWSSFGVTPGGAADALSLRIGNRLVGNREDAPAIEMTLTGGAFVFESESVIALVGGLADASIEGEGFPTRPIEPCVPTLVRAGETVRIGPIRRGVRSYLCIAGGTRVAPALGSASTHLAGAFGGFEGRALRAGDRVPLGEARTVAAARSISEVIHAAAARTIREVLDRRTIRATPGAHAAAFDAAPGSDELFWNSSFTIANQSDRVGMRLEAALGAPKIASPHGGRLISEGMPHGAVQVPESGQPIILMADHPTTGGYPVIACVAAVDLPVLGQLRPREAIRFERVSLEEARTLCLQREERFNAEVPRA
jgi:antagonist of KipI